MKYFFILFLHYGKGYKRKKNTLDGKKKNKGLSYGKILTKKIKVRGGSCWSQGVKDPPCYCNFGYIYI